MTPRTDDPDPFEPVIRQIQRGIAVEQNYERLYKHFHPRLLRHFLWRGLPETSAEDLCQQVFIQVFHSLDRFEGRSRFARWLFEIAHNTYINDLRRQAAAKRDGRELPLQEEHSSGEDPEQSTAPALQAPGPDPFAEVLRREQAAQLRDALESLPPQMRRCVYLRIYQGLKFREVAAVMNVSLDTVKAHLGQAKKRLKTLLTDDRWFLAGPGE